MLESARSKPSWWRSERELDAPLHRGAFLVVLEAEHRRAAQQVGQGAHDPVTAQAE